ncbi:ribosome-inactivating family protein [Streptomyces violascens]|uniref:Uncharacterized protein n=1 Tax=Streptomyces violascens TaxID=67381 RepID=A0ABQ3QF32_9ACTN|nr:ribosome-inactivating family protein [Streptomyces violascens]GGU46816.1 hypothetical protein GCM10010289_79140 [Streptomyces violascens]GHI35832.1 hypothetical protein Sviol_02400 [Streptomyces violascens]
MLNLRRVDGRALSRLLAVLVVLALGLGAGLAGPGRARADTANGRIKNARMTVTQAGRLQAQSYVNFIREVQNAAGHPLAPRLQQTQTNNLALLRADIEFAGQQLQLWITPDNMYLRGFTNAAGDTFAFNDYPLETEMQAFVNAHSPDVSLLPTGRFRTLPYAASYTAIERAAGRGRDNTPLTHGNLVGSTSTLLTTGNPNANTAGALLFFIQFVSEAARFRLVAEDIGRGMQGVNTGRGVPAELQELENDWGHASDWAYREIAGHNQPEHNVGRLFDRRFGPFRTLADLAAAVMMLQGAPGGDSQV